MYRMVVSDFYGTLIDSEEAISLSTMIELDRIRKAGVLFCITTSKSARVVIDYNKDFPFIDYVIAFNGSYIYDLVNDKVLYDKGLGVSVVKKIYKLFSDKDLCFYTLEHCNYTGVYKDKDFSEMLIDIPTFIEENRNGIYKISICLKSLKEAKDVIKIIKSAEIKVDTYLKEIKDFYIVEVTNSLNSKLDGVEKIIKKRKISLTDVLAVCSSASSFDLVKCVGHGCCVSNGSDKIKKVAKEITLSNEEKGVEKIIKKYF